MRIIRHQLIHLIEAINQRMHAGATCPTLHPKPLGECPIIEKDGRWQGRQRYVAVLLLWPGSEHLTTVEVVNWFKDAGCQVLRITQVMHERGLYVDIEEGFDRTPSFQGGRQWDVQFVQAVPA